MERKLTAIVAMDVVGYSGLMERSEEATLEGLIQLRKAVIDPEIHFRAPLKIPTPEPLSGRITIAQRSD